MDNPGDAKYGLTRPQMTEAFKTLKELGAKEFGIHAFLASNTVTNEYYPMLAKSFSQLLLSLLRKQAFISDLSTSLVVSEFLIHQIKSLTIFMLLVRVFAKHMRKFLFLPEWAM